MVIGAKSVRLLVSLFIYKHHWAIAFRAYTIHYIKSVLYPMSVVRGGNWGWCKVTTHNTNLHATTTHCSSHTNSFDLSLSRNIALGVLMFSERPLYKCTRSFQFVHWNALIHLKSLLSSRRHPKQYRVLYGKDTGPHTRLTPGSVTVEVIETKSCNFWML